VGAALEGRAVVVTVVAPEAPAPLGQAAAAAGEVPLGSAHVELRGDFGLVLAGAIAAELGGELRVACAGPTRGLRLILRLPVA
jgi:hypothetical protein